MTNHNINRLFADALRRDDDTAAILADRPAELEHYLLAPVRAQQEAAHHARVARHAMLWLDAQTEQRNIEHFRQAMVSAQRRAAESARYARELMGIDDD